VGDEISFMMKDLLFSTSRMYIRCTWNMGGVGGNARERVCIFMCVFIWVVRLQVAAESAINVFCSESLRRESPQNRRCTPKN